MTVNHLREGSNPSYATMSTKLKWIHFTAILLFLAIWVAAAVFGWLSSVVFVSHMSMLALVYAAASAYQGARTEEKEDKQ